MKQKLKLIIPVFIAVILITVIIIFNIPYNLYNALRFDESDWIVMSVVIMKNVNGQIVNQSESFTFEKGTIEFEAINEVFYEYSYYRTFAKNNGKLINEGDLKAITISSENNSGVYLTNSRSSNIIVNGTFRRMGLKKVVELTEKILGICGMQ